MAAQAANSFLESFETSSVSMSATLLMLAVHPQQQDQLREELRAAFPDGKLEYEALCSHRYLDQVISGEWLLAARTTRAARRRLLVERRNFRRLC